MRTISKNLYALILMIVGLITSTAANAQSLPPSLFLPELILSRDEIEAASRPVALKSAVSPQDISKLAYTFKGEKRTFEGFLSKSKVKSFMVLKDGQVIYEYHQFPSTPATLHQSWSISKQVLSALVGIAMKEGAIQSINDRMDKYDARLHKNGFSGVTFKQALQMSSGIKYAEESDRYSLFWDVISNYYSAGFGGKTLTEKALDTKLTRVYAPGSAYSYASINSEAIKMALEKAVGMKYQDYLKTRLWEPMGMPDEAKILVDREKSAFVFCCLYATTRAYAMFGQMYAQSGWFNGREIVPSNYVRNSTTFAGDDSNWHAINVPRKDGSAIRGFGYHWWPLEGGREDFLAAGVHGRSIHVLPKQKTVVVRISGDYENLEGSSHEAVILGRAIADYLE